VRAHVQLLTENAMIPSRNPNYSFCMNMVTCTCRNAFYALMGGEAEAWGPGQPQRMTTRGERLASLMTMMLVEYPPECLEVAGVHPSDALEPDKTASQPFPLLATLDTTGPSRP